MKHALAALLFGASLFGSSLVALAPRPAAAQSQIESREAIALNNQIAELRHDVEQLRDQIRRGGGGGSSVVAPVGIPSGGSGNSDLTAQLLDRVSQLEDEVRTLRGRMDEADNARTQMNQDFNKQIGDLRFQMGGAAGAAGAGAVGAGAAVGAAAATPPAMGDLAGGGPAAAAGAAGGTAARTPTQILQDGNAALARRDYAAAEASAKAVLAGPKSSSTPAAQFLLGQSYAGRRDWAHAAVAYDDAYRGAPNGPRAQDAQLGLAASLIGLGDKTSACQALSLIRTPRPDLRDRVIAERQRAGCR